MAVNTRIIISGQDRGASRAFRNLGKNATRSQRQVFGVNSALKQTDKSVMGLNTNLTRLAGAGGGLLLLSSAIGALKQSLAIKIDFDRINNTLKAVTGTSKGAKEEMGFLADEANRLGLELRPLAGTYTRLLASTKLIGLSTEQTREVFTGFSEALTTFGSSRQQSIRVFAALEQIAAKGVVSMEELRQQLGEALPGAFVLGARAMGKTQEEFAKLVAQGKVLSKDFLLPFTREVRESLGKGAVSGAQLLNRELDRLTNTGESLFLAFAEGEGGVGGFASGFSEALKSFRKELGDGSLKQTVAELGSVAGEAFANIAKFATTTAKAIDSVTSSIGSLTPAILALGVGLLRMKKTGGIVGAVTGAGGISTAGGTQTRRSTGFNTLRNSIANNTAMGGRGGSFYRQASTGIFKVAERIATRPIKETTKIFTSSLKIAGKGIRSVGRSFSNLAGGPVQALIIGLTAATAVALKFQAAEKQRQQAEAQGDRSEAQTRAFNRRREINERREVLNSLGGRDIDLDIRSDIKRFEQEIENSRANFLKFGEGAVGDVENIFREAIVKLRTELTGRQLDKAPKTQEEALRNIFGRDDLKPLKDQEQVSSAFRKTSKSFLDNLDKERVNNEFIDKLKKDQVSALEKYNSIINKATESGLSIDETLKSKAVSLASQQIGKGGETTSFAPIQALNALQGARAKALQSGITTPGKSREQREKELLKLIKDQSKQDKENQKIWKDMGEGIEGINQSTKDFINMTSIA